MQEKSFAFSITTEELEEASNEKELFISKNILIPFSYEQIIPFDENLCKFLTEEEALKQRKEAEKPLIHSSYKYNPILVDQIYNEFLFQLEESIDDYVGYSIDKVKLKLKLTQNNTDKNKILKKHIKKHVKEISKISLADDLFLIDKDLNLKSYDCINLIKGSISFEDDIIYDFLINGYNMNFFDYHLFDEYHKIAFCQKVIKRLNSIKNNRSDFFSDVFINEQSEEILYEILLNENVIDSANNATKGFQNVAYNFYSISNTLRDKIFIKKITLKKYANYLESRYNTTIKNPDKMGNKTHLVDTISNMVKSLLKE